ncbi:ATP-binding cassette domain-containing protein [Cytobacillus depressus]|uniref:Autoinducer 2 import ATP-binding protein LsrA n=1 Tax=Cytobacillus depressus TaxID=1602942 RepID=A0A6L3V8X6_9BACI|nr:ATP-binding cassette domain-containing protein [Cytobacillus depressus]KAB2334734.1 ATP-binding cassette domain-containing protein [Cytobacillus depressus]
MNNKDDFLLEIRNLHKQFSSNAVLKGVDITLKAGEVHAIVGGNGAGKSTLMKIITGLYQSDSGVMKVKGIQASFSNSYDAHLHGIYLVPQEPLIFPNMSVEENIMIGLPESKSHLRQKIDIILKRLGWKLDLQKNAVTLAIAEQQLVEIIRGLVREAEILILDEPTSALTFGEIDSLFKLIKQLTSEGIGVFYITHRFSEIFTLANTVSLLRDGIISARGPVSEFTYESLVEGLVPESVSAENILKENETLTEPPSPRNPSAKEALRVSNISGRRFQNISFDIFPGEILGIAGVVGAGRTEIAEAIFGLMPIEKGSVYLGDTVINQYSIRQRIHNGLVYVPEDRHTHGIFSIASIKNNISSTILHRLRGLFLPFNQEKDMSRKFMADLKIKAANMNQELKDLSGGNQQKVVLSKYLAAEPKVIILDEPTRGIDANARMDIYRIIMNLKLKGLAVLLISSDIEEVHKLSDKVLVIHEGSIMKLLEKNETTVDEITATAFGVKKEATA